MVDQAAMRRSLVLVFAGLALVGCGRRPAKFVEPPAEAPHALTVVRTVHLEPHDGHLDETLDIGGRRVELGARLQENAAIRVAPGAARWAIRTRYSHVERRSQLEWVNESVSEWDSCARRDSRGDCEGGTRYVTKSGLQTVTRNHFITDAACDVADSFLLTAGRSYRLTYTFSGSQKCTLTCDDMTDGPAIACAHPEAAATSYAAASPRGSSSPVAQPVQGAVHPLAGVGVGAMLLGSFVLIGAGGATLFALSKKADVDKHCSSAGTCDSDGLAAAHDGGLAVRWANIGAIAGGALAVGGLGLVIFGPTRAGTPATTASVAPRPGGAQVTLGGSF